MPVALTERKILNLNNVERKTKEKETLVAKSMKESKLIGFIEFFGKINAIVVKEGKVELQETKLKRFDCS